ncbi:MAG: BatA domain-containing protein, partial [Bacteroidales bacterium]|nr:BatA domain-containing protein [Bacteroidales bacterium]
MQFANPNYLWALSAILIPIIVHIFQFRKLKNTYFTNVDLLKELNVERRKVSRLKQLIILGLRILAIIALVFVFAGPYIPKDNGINTSGSNLINI